ncbi:fatty acid desaturase CarF family protein [Sphingomonas sp.]|uniref:fatty acid desaturase CarF family protein n=1 Tax=Sphingomonas sp. TaxID=28214 RepID=UPI003B008625
MRTPGRILLRAAPALLAAVLALDIALMLRSPSLWMLPAVLAGWYAADLMSGVVHMYMDYRPCPPLPGLNAMFFYEGARDSEEYIALRDETFASLGPFERLVYDFKNHHPRPDALGRRSLRITTEPTVLFTTLPFALGANMLAGALALAGIATPGWAIAGMIAFVLGATFAQYFHGSLHREDVPWLVRAMRRARLLMRPEDHVAHHDTLTRDFSTINGWSNPPLNLIFRTLRQKGRLRDEGLIPR